MGTGIVGLGPKPARFSLMTGQEGAKVDDQIRLQSTGLNIERGFIDFVRSGNMKGPITF
jgi:hypothetical protein